MFFLRKGCSRAKFYSYCTLNYLVTFYFVASFIEICFILSGQIELNLMEFDRYSVTRERNLFCMKMPKDNLGSELIIVSPQIALWKGFLINFVI